MAPKKNKKQQKKNPPPDIQSDVYKVHKVIFKGKQTLVVGHNKGGQSPLLALTNLLLLRHGQSKLETFEMADETLWVRPKKLHSFICPRLSHVVNPSYHRGSLTEKHRGQLMKKYKAGLDHLLSGHPAGGAYPKFSGIKDFAYVGEGIAPLELLCTPLSFTMYHALIPDPKDTDLCTATKGQLAKITSLYADSSAKMTSSLRSGKFEHRNVCCYMFQDVWRRSPEILRCVPDDQQGGCGTFAWRNSKIDSRSRHWDQAQSCLKRRK